MLDDGLSRLLLTIHESVDDEDRWTSTLAEISHRLGAGLTIVGVIDPAGHKVVGITSSRMDHRIADAQREYLEGIAAGDPTLTARPREGMVLHSHQLFTDIDAYRGNAFIRWNKDRIGSAYWTSQYAAAGRHLVSLSVHMPDEPLAGDGAAMLPILASHIGSALSHRCAPPAQQDEAIMLLDSQGYIHITSDRARRYLLDHSALWISAGRLRARNRLADQAMQALIGAALDPATPLAARAVRLPRDDGGELLAIIRRTLPAAGPLPILRNGVEIRLVDVDDQPTVHIEVWRDLFHFTKGEARFAAALLAGGSLRDTADRLGISYETARAYAKSVAQKADVTTQAELVQILCRTL